MCQLGGLTTPRPLLKWPLQQSRGAARDITPRSFPYAPGRPQAGHDGIPAGTGSRPTPAQEHRPPCADGRASVPLPNPTEDLPPEIPAGVGGCIPPSRVWLRYYSEPRQRARSPAPAHPCIPPHLEAASPARQPAHQAVLPRFRNPLKGKNRWQRGDGAEPQPCASNRRHCPA